MPYSKPTDSEIDSTILKLSRATAARYLFFSKLENPEWLEPLAKRDYFNAPMATKDDETGGIICPQWTEATYIKSMAKTKPEIVKDILLKNATNSNFRVQNAIVDIALELPPNHSATIGLRLASGFEKDLQIGFGNEIGKLIGYLATNYEYDAAIKLLSSVLRGFNTDRQGGIAEWYLENFFNDALPELLNATPFRLVEVFIKQVSRCIGKGKECPYDYSYVGWPSLLQDARYKSVESVLTNALLQASRASLRSNAATLSEIAELFQSKRWFLFLRIALLLVGENVLSDRAVAIKLILDESHFNEAQIRPEYVFLLNNYIKQYGSQDCAAIIEKIIAGPDLETWKNNCLTFYGKTPTSEEEQVFKENWIWEWLVTITADLPQNVQTLKDNLIAERGTPPNDGHQTIWHGPTSPLSSEDLETKGTTEIIQYLLSWKPSDGFREPTPEGLGRVLKEVAKKRSQAFLDNIDDLKKLRPTYVRNILEGICEDIPQARWIDILILCEWILHQSENYADASEKNANRWDDDSWRETKIVMARVLSNAFKAQSGVEADIKLRGQFLEVIDLLVLNKNPSADEEAAAIRPDGMGPATLALNTVRGKALHCLIQWGLWLGRHQEKAPLGDYKELIIRYKTVIERELSGSNRHSLTNRSVLGQWYPWLHLVDSIWACGLLDEIYPTSADRASEWRAAWGTYIKYVQPYDEILKGMLPKYQHAIGLLKNKSELDSNATSNLSSHLLTFYWRGKIGLEDGGLISAFFSLASQKEISNALEFVGRSLYQTRDAISEDIIKRLIDLWDYSLKHIDVSDSDRAFLHWFASRKLPVEWSLSQLHSVLDAAQTSKSALGAIQYLADLVESHPAMVIDCLTPLLEKDKNGSYLHEEDKILLILSCCVKGSDLSVSAKARRLANYLVEAGHFKFREILV